MSCPAARRRSYGTRNSESSNISSSSIAILAMGSCLPAMASFSRRATPRARGPRTRAVAARSRSEAAGASPRTGARCAAGSTGSVEGATDLASCAIAARRSGGPDSRAIMRSNPMLVTAAILALAGCGGVENQAEPDAATPEPDAPVAACTIHDTVQSCGATCAVCPQPARAMPTCNGTACGFTCNVAGPRCSDDSCSRLRFDFESNSIEDIRAKTPNLPLAVRNKNGTLALAIDLTSLFVIQIAIPVCLAGTIDVHTRTMRARILFDGGE